MTILRKVARGERFIGSLRHGADLLEAISEICREKKIQLGWVTGLGAVRKARIGFYEQSRREYEFLEIDQPLEITSLTGNISLKDGSPFVHAHITLADSSGEAYGGHLAPGTIVFACELAIEVLEGTVLQREFDRETGLALWPMKPGE